MTPPPTSTRLFHPLAWKFFVAGLAVLTVGVIRVNLFGPKAPVLPVIAPATQAREPGPMRIVVTLPPLMWAVQALAPPDAQITLLTPPGAGCEGIELTPTQAAAINTTDLLVCSGSVLDQQVKQRGDQAKGARIVVLAMSETIVPDLPKLPGTPHNQQLVLHYSGPHLWLDPALMEQWIESLLAALERVFGDICGPNYSNSNATRDCVADSLLFKRHCVKQGGSLAQQSRDIDAEYRDRLAPFKGRSIVTHHDAWSAVAHRYGLEVAAVIQHTHDAEPSPADLADAARIMKAKGIKAIFIEPQLNPAAANRIAEITGAKVLTLDPLGDGDWPAMMRKNLDALVEGLSTP
jgi:ABC-type Zn uptake system ZnuABC Zn-binding protein ZnuA